MHATLPPVVGDWIPSRCELCSRPTNHRHGLCLTCERTLPFVDPLKVCRYCAAPLKSFTAKASPNPRSPTCELCNYERPAVDRLRSLLHYRSPLDMWVPRLKFHNELNLARMLGAMFADRVFLPPENKPEFLIPLPLHIRRLGERGYDQPLEICKPIAERLGIPLRTDILSRERSTKRQSEMDMEHRQTNLMGAFSVNLSTFDCTLSNHVAIFDDVYTTGATINEAAWCLRNVGIEKVEAWVIAHAD